jgi:hypothetical protein
MADRENRELFPKNATERIEVWAEPYKGRDLIHARIHYLDASGEWRPSPKGLSLSPALAGQVASAMADCARALIGDEDLDPTLKG